MNRNNVVDLLSLAAAFDQRTAGEIDVTAWWQVAEAENWTPAAAQRVIIKYYSRGADKPRITPAAITDGIRAARRKAAASFVAPDAPDHVTGRQYPEWYREQLAAHIDRVLAEWAATGKPISESPTDLGSSSRPALDTSTCPPQLRRQITDGFNRIGRPQ
jgi:hypothetical protein